MTLLTARVKKIKCKRLRYSECGDIAVALKQLRFQRQIRSRGPIYYIVNVGCTLPNIINRGVENAREMSLAHAQVRATHSQEN